MTTVKDFKKKRIINKPRLMRLTATTFKELNKYRNKNELTWEELMNYFLFLLRKQ